MITTRSLYDGKGVDDRRNLVQIHSKRLPRTFNSLMSRVEIEVKSKVDLRGKIKVNKDSRFGRH